MKRRFTTICLAVCLVVTLSAARVANAPAETDWQTVAIGIDYREFRASGPNNVFVARMDRSNPNVTLDSSLGNGFLAEPSSGYPYGRQTVRGQAGLHDQSIGYWGRVWGSRNRVVVAINGYYFDDYTGVPWRGQSQSGWYIKRFDNMETGSGFSWTLNGDAFIGECVTHYAQKQKIKFLETDTFLYLNGLNRERRSDELILYTSQYFSNTKTDASGVEVVVEMSRPVSLYSAQDGIAGTIKAVRNGQGASPIQFDHIVLSASGTAAADLLANANEGQQIGVFQEMANFALDIENGKCDSNSKLSSLDWTNTYASIGGDFYFLRNGIIHAYTQKNQATVRDPRTAIAFNDQYIFFIVVDGRNPGVSVGMRISELAQFARDTLGATYGIAEDSGGSSTMVVNGEVKNNTTCNFTDCAKTTDLSATPSPPLYYNRQPAPVEANGLLGEVTGDQVEALVANGMMMVSVEPRYQSNNYVQDDFITLSSPTNIRLGPGTNYAIIDTLSSTDGVVLDHPLNGVYARGWSWWKVKFGPTIGWVAQTPTWPFSLSLPFISNLNPLAR